MQLHDAIGLFQAQIVNMDGMWAYYSTATLAVLGFTVASDRATRSRHEILIIQLGYLLFAIGNAAAIASSQGSLIELSKLVIAAGGTEALAYVFTVFEVMVFHSIVTVSVLMLIEVTYRYNKSLSKKVENKE